MLSRFWKWFAGVFAEHTVLQLIAAVPAAYLTGLAIQLQQGAEAVLEALPPLFWPTLAILVLAVTIYSGFVLPIIRHRRDREQVYWNLVNGAYQYVSQVHRPEILDPACPGNPHAIREYAQNRVDTLRPLLIKKRGSTRIPSEIDVMNPDSLCEWYNCLRRERAHRHVG